MTTGQAKADLHAVRLVSVRSGIPHMSHIIYWAYSHITVCVWGRG